MGIVLNEDWTANVVGQMHKFKIRNPELADKCGYHPSYLSTVLNGNKVFKSDEGHMRTRERVESALAELIAERMREIDGSED